MTMTATNEDACKYFQFSFEVFPPKKNAPIEVIYDTVAELSKLRPDYISVTYGAGGGAATASATVEICSLIKNTYKTETVAHLPGINLSKDQVSSLLQRLKAHNIDRVLALRGDRRPSDDPRLQEGDFHYAVELVRFIKSVDAKNFFQISAACYPEVHCDAPDAATDLLRLKEKVTAGTSLLISQLFFDNSRFYDFVQRARSTGIDVPIQAGIMPLANIRQAKHITKLCNPHIPKDLQAIFDKYESGDKSFHAAAIDFASRQIMDLKDHGVEGVHLYTMNSPKTASEISENIGWKP